MNEINFDFLPFLHLPIPPFSYPAQHTRLETLLIAIWGNKVFMILSPRFYISLSSNIPPSAPSFKSNVNEINVRQLYKTVKKGGYWKSFMNHESLHCSNHF